MRRAPLFNSEDRLEAFCAAVRTHAARRFISLDQQLELAKDIIKRRMRAQHIQEYVSQWVREAARAQGKIDEVEEKDFYKQFPGHEIRDEVAAAKSTARSFAASLLKLEALFKKFPHHPFFGDLGSTLDSVINMIRQYRRAAGEKNADETERKFARLAELEQKARTQESVIDGLRREVEELRAKLEAGGDMSISEFQTAIKKWEETVETQKNIIRDLQNEIANLRTERERAR
jgi:chromosome segregation ATPase